MHTVELLEEARRTALALGYQLREEWLGGSEGGACEIAGRKWLFIDLSQNPAEQLETVVAALREEASQLDPASLSGPLRQLLRTERRAA